MGQIGSHMKNFSGNRIPVDCPGDDRLTLFPHSAMDSHAAALKIMHMTREVVDEDDGIRPVLTQRELYHDPDRLPSLSDNQFTDSSVVTNVRLNGETCHSLTCLIFSDPSHMKNLDYRKTPA